MASRKANSHSIRLLTVSSEISSANHSNSAGSSFSFRKAFHKTSFCGKLRDRRPIVRRYVWIHADIAEEAPDSWIDQHLLPGRINGTPLHDRYIRPPVHAGEKAVYFNSGFMIGAVNLQASVCKESVSCPEMLCCTTSIVGFCFVSAGKSSAESRTVS